MKDRIIYVELKSGYSDNGPAWIGKGSWSKSGRTVYFNGKALQAAGGGGNGNYLDIETGEGYWVSGVKKNREDRHWAGSGMVMIDALVVEEYLAITGSAKLDSRKFKTVQLDHGDVASRVHELQNRPIR